jgi:hypothetical protein
MWIPAKPMTTKQEEKNVKANSQRNLFKATHVLCAVVER